MLERPLRRGQLVAGDDVVERDVARQLDLLAILGAPAPCEMQLPARGVEAAGRRRRQRAQLEALRVAPRAVVAVGAHALQPPVVAAGAIELRLRGWLRGRRAGFRMREAL